MTLHTPVFVQPVSGDTNFPNGIPFTAQELRRYTQAVLAIAGYPAQSGVAQIDGQYQVSQRAAGANLSVDVAAGTAFVIGSDVSAQGPYACWNDGVVNVVVPAPPASGTENHRLVLQIQDRFSNGAWTGYTASLNLLADTGSGTPAQPASSITLALIAVSAGQASVLNANITDQRPMLGAVPSTTNVQVTNTTTPGPITTAFTIPANDAQVGTQYTIEVPVAGIYESAKLNIGMLVGSTFTTLLTMSSAAFTAGHGFGGTIRLNVVVTSTGTTGTANVWISGSLSDTTVDRTSGNTLTLDGLGVGLTFNTTVANALAVGASWSALSTGQQIRGQNSLFSRKGP